MKVWRSTVQFDQIFALRDTLYVSELDFGLKRMEDDVLAMVPGGNLFQKEAIRGLVPWGEAAFLAVTWSSGMFLCSTRQSTEAACIPFKPGLTKFLLKYQPYNTTLLPKGRLAIGTERGVVLLDHEGRLLRILNESSGLRDEDILSTYIDKQGGLWLALNNGLARVEVTTSLSYFDKTLGLLGSVEHVARHQGTLYAATSFGIYRLRPKADVTPAHFEPMPGISDQCWTLLSTEEALLAGCNKGLFDVDSGQWLWKQNTVVFALHRSQRDPTLLYLGLEDGLVQIHLNAGRWDNAKRIDGVRELVRSIVEDAQGELWMGTDYMGVLRLNPASDSEEQIITRYGVADGLPAVWIHVKTVAGLVRFLGEGRLFSRVDTVTRSSRDSLGQISDLGFMPDTTFHTLLAQDSSTIDVLTEDHQGRVWIAAGEASGVAYPSAEGGYTFAFTALRRVPHLVAWNMVADAGDQVWIGSHGGLIHLDGNRSLDNSTDYPVWIRRITTTGDSLLYDGQSGEAGETEPWPYTNNALRFAFAAPSYDAPERTHYRTRLDGLDDHWSDWSTETDKDYTNLWEGRYVFQVQARDVYGFVSREDTFDFRILPPWYRTWYMYITYAITLIGLLYLLYRWRAASLIKEKLILEKIVKDRTKKLETQTKELIKLDQFKESMTGMIVHDLKNPLNVILNAAEKEPVKNLRRVKQTGKQMLNMVLNILDVHKYEETKMIVDKLDYSLFEISLEAINEIDFLAQQKNIEIKNKISKGTTIKADKEIIERVFVNILTNAIKYTPNNGIIDLKSFEKPSGFVQIKITDSGQGIPQDQLSKIFDKFGQVTAKKSGKMRSTGLGLTFCKMAVEAHGGEIGVESEIENLPAANAGGTAFWLTLPIGKDSEKAKKSGNVEQKPVQEMGSNITLLTTDEKMILKPFILQFKECEIYEITILRDLLKQIDLSENENINSWKEEMSKAIKSGNEELYKELIDGRTKE
ncbi:MAG: hypothetical protein GY696_03185 [Gammaproteobacteria bacterium]|nr:hypothetical protein [Gammaproteobacteria bacterium]